MKRNLKLADPIIRVTNVSKVFGRRSEQALELRRSGQSKHEVEQATQTTVAIFDAHFEVQKGEIFVLIGLSGSGKSTLLRCLNGLVEPTETESKETLDAFADVMIRIAKEAEENPDVVLEAPHTTVIGRLDEVQAARQPILRYTKEETVEREKEIVKS